MNKIKMCGDKNRNKPDREKKTNREEVTEQQSDQFFELGRAIRDLDWIEMGFVIDRHYGYISILSHPHTP